MLYDVITILLVMTSYNMQTKDNNYSTSYDII